MSTPTAVLSRTSQSAEDTALSEGLTLADLLEVLGDSADPGWSAGTADDGDAHEPRGLRLRERMQGWTELVTALSAGPRGSWRTR